MVKHVQSKMFTFLENLVSSALCESHMKYHSKQSKKIFVRSIAAVLVSFVSVLQ